MTAQGQAMTPAGRRYGLPWRGAEVARTAEAAGVAAFCSGEFVDHEAYSTLAEMELHTERAQVGPGIAYAFARTPYAHAAGIRGVWRHAPGRVFLGLGSGAYKINRDWFGVETAAVIGKTVRQFYGDEAWVEIEPRLNAALAGQEVSYERDMVRPEGRRRAACRRSIGLGRLIDEPDQDRPQLDAIVVR